MRCSIPSAEPRLWAHFTSCHVLHGDGRIALVILQVEKGGPERTVTLEATSNPWHSQREHRLPRGLSPHRIS